MKKGGLLFLFVFISFSLFAQNVVRGRIFDVLTGTPMAFVNVIYNDAKQGTISDINGYFDIPKENNPQYLKCSFVGYQTKLVKFNNDGKDLKIQMTPMATTLDEVTVLPGENPAHRIINNVIENKKNNDPANLDNYQFTSYSKMYFTIDTDSLRMGLKTDSLGQIVDTSGRANVVNFLDEHHLFLMESVTEKSFKNPDKIKEKILASRVSGLQHPSFTYLASEYQSFSFYGEYIEVAESKYISPLCNNSPQKYLFLLKDTVLTSQGDTTFIMSYRPRSNTNFKGLKGLIYINTDGWAIQNVIAEPFEDIGVFKIRIQQNYNKLDSLYWFPVQLNTDFIFDFVEFYEDGDTAATVSIGNTDTTNRSSVSPKLLGVGKTYIKDVYINDTLHEKIRGGTEIEYAKDANKKDSVYWNQFRVQNLDERELNTYNMIDSIGEEYHMDNKLAMLEILATGKIPISIINIDLNELTIYNKYEGYRLGLGVETNGKVSKIFSLNVYGAYGFTDDEFKYGSGLKISPFKNDRLNLGVNWSHDLKEADSYSFHSGLLNGETFRDFFVENMDWYDTWRGSLESKLFRGFSFLSYLDFNTVDLNSQYRYFHTEIPLSQQFWETGLECNWIIREDIIRTPSGNIMSKGSKYPDLHFNIRRGLPYKVNEIEDYWRLEARFHDVLKSKWIGDLHITADAGILLSDNEVYTQNFMLHGSGRWLDADNSFATMGVHEYITDKFVAVFLKYDIGSLLFHVKKWKPEFALVTNAGIGDYQQKENLSVWPESQSIAKIPDQGYIESGLQISSIMRQMVIGYGVGVYYHYGPYSSSSPLDNFAVKFRLTYNL